MNILQLCRIPVYPAQNGAAVRVQKTAEKLTEFGDLWFAAPPSDRAEPPAQITRIELDTPFLTRRMLRNEGWLALFAWSEKHPLSRLQTDAIMSAVGGYDVAFDVIVAEFPQVTGAALELAASHGAKLLLNKHNAAYEILDAFLDQRPVPTVIRDRAVTNLRDFEYRTVAASDVVVFQSVVDRDRFADLGTVTKVIPNGCDYEAIRSGGNPRDLADRLGIDRDSFVCVFVGSYSYEPNRAAARLIADVLAPAFPDVEFLLVGRSPPETARSNVHAPGYVEDLAGALRLADIALCPLFAGSGTKLKMLDYFAAGLPVVSTSIGIQGLPVEDGRHVLVQDSIAEFEQAIERLKNSPRLRTRLARRVRGIAADHAWPTLMAEYEDVFEHVLAAPA